MEQTPMQELIKELKDKVAKTPVSKAIDRRVKGAYVDCIMIAMFLLEKEKQAILNAYDCGKEQPSNSQQCPIDYYDSTFKQ